MALLYRRYSATESLVPLLASLVAVVMLISAWIVFWTAFRDGSLEQDDLCITPSRVNTI
jgi:hypothetical protein